MAGYNVVNLNDLLEVCGEEHTKELLSNFSCPLNADVENFLHTKAIDFAARGFAQTHLVFASYQGKQELVGYFTLANKYITVSMDALNSKLRSRIRQYANWDKNLKCYCLAAPLIGQLGKNYTNGLNEQITGDELLLLACKKVQSVQMAVGGRCVYLECEDKDRLVEFYESNGFVIFDKRPLDKDETNLEGKYLLQLLRYLPKDF